MRATAIALAAMTLATPAFAMDRELSAAEQRYFGQALLPFVAVLRTAAAAGMRAPECELRRRLGKPWDKAPEDPKDLVSAWGQISDVGVAPSWNLSWTCRE